MVGFINLGLSIRMPASAGQEHSLVVKTDIMDKCVLIIRYGLFKCPKIIISSSHKKSAIPVSYTHLSFTSSPVMRGLVFFSSRPAIKSGSSPAISSRKSSGRP